MDELDANVRYVTFLYILCCKLWSFELRGLWKIYGSRVTKLIDMDFSQHFICGHECGLVRLLVLFFFFFSLALKRQIWLHMFPDHCTKRLNKAIACIRMKIQGQGDCECWDNLSSVQVGIKLILRTNVCLVEVQRVWAGELCTCAGMLLFTSWNTRQRPHSAPHTDLKGQSLPETLLLQLFYGVSLKQPRLPEELTAED